MKNRIIKAILMWQQQDMVSQEYYRIGSLSLPFAHRPFRLERNMFYVFVGQVGEEESRLIE